MGLQRNGCSRGQTCSFKHDPAKKEQYRRKDQEAVARSPWIQEASERERALRERQRSPFCTNSNRCAVTRKDLRAPATPKNDRLARRIQCDSKRPFLRSEKRKRKLMVKGKTEHIHICCMSPHRDEEKRAHAESWERTPRNQLFMERLKKNRSRNSKRQTKMRQKINSVIKNRQTESCVQQNHTR